MKTIVIYALLLVVFVSGVARSEEKELEVVYENDGKQETYHEIVVTADKSSQDTYDVPLPVTTLKREYLEENMFTSMTDLLDSAPGFSSRYEYHSTIYMRGFSGNNILLLQDGCRRISTTPKGTRANKLSAFNIERIEIIRGPGSVMYGSGALTGIVHVLTTDIFKHRGLDIQYNAHYATNNNERDTSCLATYATDDAAWNIGARYRKADDYTLPDGSEAEHSYLEDRDVVGKIGFRPTEDQELILSADMHLGGPWSKAAGFNGKPNMQVYYDQEDTYHVSLEYTIREALSLDLVRMLAYYDYEKTKSGKKWFSTSGSVTSDSVSCMKDHYGGGSLHLQKQLGRHRLSSGCDAYLYRVWIDDSEYSTIAGPEPTYEETESVQGGGSDSAGYYFQDMIAFKRVTLTCGARYDYARVIEGDHHAASLDTVAGYEDSKMRSAASGNIGMVYNFFRQLFWSINVGRAFRMPNYNEMYSETLTGKGVVSGNPEVEPEYSLNIDTGLRGYVADFRFDLNGFINFYDDLIKEELVDPADSDSGYLYRNIDRARVYGYECEAAYAITNVLFHDAVLTPSLAATYYVGDDLGSKGYLDFSDTEPLYYVPNPECNAHLRYTIRKKRASWFIDLGYTHAFQQNRVPEGEDTYDAYDIYEAKTGMEVKNVIGLERLTCYLTVKNLTNEEYYLFADYLPAKGRDFRFMLSATY